MCLVVGKRGSSIVSPLLSLEVATPENKQKQFESMSSDVHKKYAQGTEVRLTCDL